MAKNKKADGYLTAKEIREISKKNRKITGEMEKKWKRKHVPESEYLTTMRDPNNAVEFDDLHTCFFTDAGTVRSVDGVTFDVPIGKTVGDSVSFGGLLGSAPVMPVNPYSCEAFVSRKGRIPAPVHSFKN